MIYRVSAEVLHLCHYKMLAKDLFRDTVVCGLSLVNPRNRGDLPPSLITDIARRFPNFVAEEDFTNLEEVFLDY